MTTKLPGLPPVPNDVSAQLKAYLTAVGEALEVRLGRRGDKLDRAVTLRELIDSGLAVQLKSAPFDPSYYNAASVGFEPNTAVDTSLPPAPTTLSADAAFQTILLEWSNGALQFNNYAFTEVFRHTADIIGDAVLVATVRGALYADQVDSGSTYYYWVRHVSEADIRGPFNQAAGTAATTINIDTIDIEDDAITTAKIVDAAIINAKIADATIDDAKISNLSAGKITTGTLSTSRLDLDNATITANASGQVQIASLGVGTAQIASAAITAAKIADANITNAKIANAAVSSAKIDNLAVDSLRITNGAVSNVENYFAASTVQTTNNTYTSLASDSITVPNGGSGSTCTLLLLFQATTDSNSNRSAYFYVNGSAQRELTYTAAGINPEIITLIYLVSGLATNTTHTVSISASGRYYDGSGYDDGAWSNRALSTFAFVK